MSDSSKNNKPILGAYSFISKTDLSIDSVKGSTQAYVTTYIDNSSLNNPSLKSHTSYVPPKTGEVIVKAINENDYMLSIYNGSDYRDLISFSFFETLYRKYCEKQSFLKRKFDRFADNQENKSQKNKTKEQKEFSESFQKLLVKKLESILTEEG